MGIIILLVIAFVLVSGLFISREYHFERSITIQAPREEVWKNVSLFANFEKWDPWKVRDAAMTRSITGTDGTVGATYAWKGNKETGSGSQTFRTIRPYEHITIDLQFREPVESKATIFYHLEPAGSGTRITWGFDSKMPYPVNAICYFFMDMENSMDKDFSAGLANLKKLCESSATMTALNDIKLMYRRNKEQAQLSEEPVKK